MKHLNLNQRKNIADFFTNLSVAIISIGVISQIISDKSLIYTKLFIIIFSIIVSGIFSVISLTILK